MAVASRQPEVAINLAIFLKDSGTIAKMGESDSEKEKGRAQVPPPLTTSRG